MSARSAFREALAALAGWHVPAPWSWDIYDGSEPPAPDAPDAQPDYRCPCCGHEWFGKPRPWAPGGQAMADARERRNGTRVLRLRSGAADHARLVRMLREIAQEYREEDVAAVVRAAVAMLHQEVLSAPSNEKVETSSCGGGGCSALLTACPDATRRRQVK